MKKYPNKDQMESSDTVDRVPAYVRPYLSQNSRVEHRGKGKYSLIKDNVYVGTIDEEGFHPKKPRAPYTPNMRWNERQTAQEELMSKYRSIIADVDEDESILDVYEIGFSVSMIELLDQRFVDQYSRETGQLLATIIRSHSPESFLNRPQFYDEPLAYADDYQCALGLCDYYLYERTNLHIGELYRRMSSIRVFMIHGKKELSPLTDQQMEFCRAFNIKRLFDAEEALKTDVDAEAEKEMVERAPPSVRTLAEEFEIIGRSARQSMRMYDKSRGITAVIFLVFWGTLTGMPNTQRIWEVYNSKPQFENLKSYFPILEPLDECPSVSTMNRTMNELPPPILAAGLSHFLFQFIPSSEGKMIQANIDGKCMRGVKLLSGLVYNLNYYISDLDLFAYMERVGEKSNEIPTVKATVGNFGRGRTYLFTLDAMGTQHSILWAIRNSGNHFCVPLKGNQGNTQRLSRGKYIESILSGAMIQKHVDLNENDTESIPGVIIQASMINVKEDNDTGVPYASEDIQPDLPPKNRKTDTRSRNIEEDIKVGLLTSGLMLDQIDESELCPGNKTLIWAKTSNGYIKMSKAHGRYERREYWIITLTEETRREFLGENNLWACVQALGLAVRFRSEDIARYWAKRSRKAEKNEPIENMKITVTVTPYLLSCSISANEFANITRKHWSVEKGHLIGDVTHVEDQLRIKGRYGPENYSWMKKMGHNVLSIVRAYERTTGTRIDGEKYYPMSYSAQQSQINAMPKYIAPFINEPIKSPFTQESFHPIKLLDDLKD